MFKPCGIRKRGDISLEDGQLLCRFEGREFGRILVGEDGLYFDGFEPIVCQLNDPPKIRLACRSLDGRNAGGEISGNRLRDGEDKMEELARLSLERANGTNNDRGQIRLSVRTGDVVSSNGDYEWRTAFVATTAYLGTLWTGAGNWLGWLWKFANPGETEPSAGSGRVSRFYSGDGRYCYNVQSDPTEEFPHGRIVQYATNDSLDESTWTAVAQFRGDPL